MRLDRLLVLQGLAPSRQGAAEAIRLGVVQYLSGTEWCLADSSKQDLPEESCLRLTDPELFRYVSRAGRKLAAALAHLGWSVAGARALDVGQSTGGFTDCLLQHGAEHVTGVDVGHGQLHEKLRTDPRVHALEGVNARTLEGWGLPADHDLCVIDVSFISQTLILPALPPLLAPHARVLSLVKPQFEAGPAWLGKGGVVSDVSCYPLVRERITLAFTNLGIELLDWFPSEVPGSDGNREFFVAGRLGA